MAFIISLIGVLLIVEGIPYFAFPAKTKEWALSVTEIPSRTLRLLGLLAMAAGLVLLYAANAFIQ